MRGRDGVKLRVFIESIGLGATPNAAARRALYSNPERQAKELMSDPDVVAAIEVLQNENRKKSTLSREEVIENLMDAYGIARMTADAQAMIRAMAEVNRMCGHYAPEKKEININGKIQRINAEIQTLSTEELLEQLGEQEESDTFEALPSPDGSFAVPQ